ncbi:DnaT-like ssDNA-binding domain-containing protein [Buchnera aphidicola (Kurisakia onigurumii)]|uniref:DnaT-like ssDNA-binding domain-containing protein n=1 Tax=Buchnera aphidicola TaxID=9 RepID=UPI0031B6EE3B
MSSINKFKPFYQITLDIFSNNYKKIIKYSKNKIIEIKDQKKTIMYILTPQQMKSLSLINNNKKKDNIIFTKKVFQNLNKIEQLEYNKINLHGKFQIHEKWMPDKDFLKKSAIWGINLKNFPTQGEIASFISYWKAEGRFFYHIQWQQKLAHSIKKSRSILYSVNKYKRDINEVATPDQKIPDGFRDK